MNFRFFIVFCIVFTSLLQEMNGQGFKAAGIIGANFAQVDGDTLFGFNLVGPSIGARLSYSNEKIWDVALEMLYSKRGAYDRFPNRGKDIHLSYLEIPIVFSLRDWYIEDQKYYKVRADFGMSYGVMFNPETEIFDVNNFRKFDFSWLAGAGIQFNKRVGMSLRYTSSFVNLYKSDDSNIFLKSYFITLRSEINF